MLNPQKVVLVVLVYIHLLKGNPLMPTNYSNPCDDWINYKNEKCLKLLDTNDPKTQEDAENACKSITRSQSRLVTVKSREEQDFLEQFLNDSESVWLGLKENPITQEFEWNDGSKLEFSNLMTSNVSGLHDQCVEMNQTGQWIAVSCNKKNMAVCESAPTWTHSILPNLESIANPTELVLKINQSEKDCEGEILKSELKTDLLKEATDKTMTLLKEAKQRIAGIERSEESTGGITYSQRGALLSFRQQTLCGDWTAYKDEKCIKVAAKTGHQTMKDAEAVCQAFSPEANRDSSPNLVTINSKEEQEFLQKFLFINNEMVDNVWLGLSKRNSNGSFEWNDGSEMSFSNWASQTLADDQHDCVQMESGDGLAAVGLWLRVSCKRKNAVVCERRPIWTLDTLQNALLNFKLEEDMKQKEWKQKFEKSDEEQGTKQQEWEQKFNKFKDDQETKNKELEKKCEKLEEEQAKTQREWEQKFMESQQKIIAVERRNEALAREMTSALEMTVPLGFNYAQLGSQESPRILWPNYKWTDVSTNYSGLFFRVVGGDAAPFGATQGSSASQLNAVELGTGHYYQNDIAVPSSGSWSSYVQVGSSTGYNQRNGLRFRLSGSEIRPRNEAVRIWKRSQ